MKPCKVAQLTFKIGISLNTHLSAIASQDKVVVVVWGLGFFFAIEFIKDQQNS